MKIKTTLATTTAALLVLGACSGQIEAREAEAAPEPTTETPEPTKEAEPEPEPTTEEPEPEPEPDLGTRDNPLTAGEYVATLGDWDVTVEPANLDAWEVISGVNQFNEPPEEGNVHVLVPVTVGYVGSESSDAWLDLDIAIVTADGRSYDSFSTMNVIPDPISDLGEMFEGGSGTGHVDFEIPAESVKGATVSVDSWMAGERAFFTLQSE